MCSLRCEPAGGIPHYSNITMTTIKKISLYLTLGAFAGLLSLSLNSCNKRNAELETDYATKKASAETLMGQINSAMTSMKDDHSKWAAALATAKKPGADTTKLNELNGDLTKHEADMTAIVSLEDSVKAYMNASPDKADEFKAADEKLGTNSNDLSDKWKSYQDSHLKLGQAISVATVAAAAAPDTTKPKAEVKKKAAPKAEAAQPVIKTEAHGVPRKSAH